MIIELRDEQNTVVDTDKVSMVRGYTGLHDHGLCYQFQMAIGFDVIVCGYSILDDSDQGKASMYKVFKEDYDKVKGALLAKEKNKEDIVIQANTAFNPNWIGTK